MDHGYDPAGRDDHHGDPADPGPQIPDELLPREAQAAKRLGTALFVKAGNHVPDDVLEDLAGALGRYDQMAGDAHVDQGTVRAMLRDVVDCARVVLDSLADPVDQDGPSEPHPGWVEQEARREALGLGLELVKAKAIGSDQLVAHAEHLRLYLMGMHPAADQVLVPRQLVEAFAARRLTATQANQLAALAGGRG